MRAPYVRMGAAGAVAAALGSVVAVLALRRPALAAELEAESGLLPEIAALGAMAAGGAAAVALLSHFLARRSLTGRGAVRNPWALERRLAGGGAILAGCALLYASFPAGVGALAGSTATFALLTPVVLGFAPSLGIGRLLLCEDLELARGEGRLPWPERDRQGHPGRYAAFSWYWSAALLGALATLAPPLFAAVSPAGTLRATGVAAIAGGLLSLWRLRDLPAAAPEGIAVVNSPWARRSCGAAFALGAIVVGAADSARGLLFGEWQRSQRDAFGVLSAVAVSALTTALFGRWYHRMSTRTAAERAFGAGQALAIGGAAALLGAFSFTYVGLVAAWLITAGSLAMAAVGLDAASWAALRGDTRRAVAAAQVVSAALGAAISSLVAGVALDGRAEQVKVALAALPCVYVGYRIARSGATAQKGADSQQGWERAPPRRVHHQSPARPLLGLEDVQVAYEDVQVLFDLNLSVQRGQIVALVGTNGAGKTTTLRAISGLEPLRSGRIVYRGLDVSRTPPTWRVEMGMQQIVGGQATADGLTVEENLRLFCHCLARGESRGRIDAALEQFPRLAERRRQRAETLSGGEKQMLALSKALIVSPSLLLIDEFSLGLAPTIVAQLLPVLRGIAEAGTSILIVEQSLSLACELAEYAYVMEKGAIRHEGPTGEVVTSAYLGALAGAANAGGGSGGQGQVSASP